MGENPKLLFERLKNVQEEVEKDEDLDQIQDESKEEELQGSDINIGQFIKAEYATKLSSMSVTVGSEEKSV